MSASTLAEVLAPFLEEAKRILPTLKSARAIPNCNDPKNIAVGLEKFITESEQLIVASTATDTPNEKIY